MSDYELLKQWIESQNYSIKTNIDNLINMVFAHYDGYLEDSDPQDYANVEYIEGCKEYIEMAGGLQEFDYYC